jgi:hypothetical protein
MKNKIDPHFTHYNQGYKKEEPKEEEMPAKTFWSIVGVIAFLVYWVLGGRL